MFGNGAGIGTVHRTILLRHHRIRQARSLVVTVLDEAVVGTIIVTVAVRRIASTAFLPAVAPTSVFVSSGVRGIDGG